MVFHFRPVAPVGSGIHTAVLVAAVLTLAGWGPDPSRASGITIPPGVNGELGDGSVLGGSPGRWRQARVVLPPGMDIETGDDPVFGDRNSNQRTTVGCIRDNARGKVEWGLELESGQCIILSGQDNRYYIASYNCLVQEENTPPRFRVVACEDAGPGSCKTDLGRNNIAIYHKPCPGSD